MSLGQTHFTRAKQEAFIAGHGTQVLIFPVLQCPCIREEQQFDPLCTSCQGTGRFYPPGQQYGTTIILHQETSGRQFYDPGSWIPGSIRATLPPGLRLCERDKLRWIDIKDTFNDEVLTRGVQDSVRFSAGVELLIVADRAQVYQSGHDYVLTLPNLVTWVAGGQSPTFMAQYSVKYSAYPEFLVVDDSPRLRVEHRHEQGQEVLLLRLDHLERDVVAS